MIGRGGRARVPRAGRWTRVASISAALVATSLLASCGNGAVSLSLRPGTVSACYRGLPTARAALHESSAKLRSVHRISLDRLQHSLPGVTLPPGDTDLEVCTFAFDGRFAPGQVTGAPLDARGEVAVVVVGSTKLELVMSYVGGSFPRHFAGGPQEPGGPRIGRPGDTLRSTRSA